MQLLLVEDNEALGRGIEEVLINNGLSVYRVNTGRAAINAAVSEAPELIILDLGLPDMDGIDVLKQLRSKKVVSQILVLTARDTISDKVKGLDAGADDYLSKPFDIDELLARIRVLERRISGRFTNDLIAGDVRLSSSAFKVYMHDEEISLSKREFTLLKTLMEAMGRVLTRSKLEDCLYEWDTDIASNALEVHVHNLRKKLGASFIKTIRGIGYTIPKIPS